MGVRREDTTIPSPTIYITRHEVGGEILLRGENL